MHDVAWRGMWIFVRSKDAQKQLARTSLRGPLKCMQACVEAQYHVMKMKKRFLTVRDSHLGTMKRSIETCFTALLWNMSNMPGI